LPGPGSRLNSEWIYYEKLPMDPRIRIHTKTKKTINDYENWNRSLNRNRKRCSNCRKRYNTRGNRLNEQIISRKMSPSLGDE
jgi:hypothetical protein